MNSVDRIKAWWAGQSGKTKQTIILGSVIGVFVAVALFGYEVREQNRTNQGGQGRDGEKPLAVDEKLLKDDLTSAVKEDVKRDLQDQQRKIDQLKDMVASLKSDAETPKAAGPSREARAKGREFGPGREQTPPPRRGPAFGQKASYPQPPPIRRQQAANSQQKKPLQEPKPRYVGGIVHSAAPGEGGADEDKDGDAEAEKAGKKNDTVFLPPSFMEGKLLTGMAASTVEGARDNPGYMMIRVQAPAVLPNEVKAGVDGCFVVAEGYGNLASERVDARTVRIACMSKDGRAVIHESIKGYLVDEDGSRGLKGIPVTKAGAAIGRAFVAGVIGGVGNATQQQTSQIAVSPLGQTQSFDPDRTAQAGLGQGIKESSDEARKFFMDLARQTSPVLEVGPTKNVTIVIVEGVELEIREYENGVG